MTARRRKCCKDCGVEKSIGQFHRSPNTRDGHINTCKVCKRAYDAERREYKGEQLRAQRAAWRSRPEVRERERRYHAAWRKTPRGRESLRITRRIQRAAARAEVASG